MSCYGKSHKCKKTDHFEIICKLVGAVETVASAWFLGAISEDTDLDEDKWFTDLLITGTTVQFRIDTGAGITIISEHMYLNLRQHPLLRNTRAVFKSPDGKLTTYLLNYLLLNFKLIL